VLEAIDGGIAGDGCLGELRIAAFESFKSLAQQLLGQPTHLHDLAVQLRQFGFV
jgi:hypothetical protein